MTKQPMIKTSDKVIAIVGDESSTEFDKYVKQFEVIMGKIVRGSIERIMVFNIVFQEMLKLKINQKVAFDFGGKKVFELKRIK